MKTNHLRGYKANTQRYKGGQRFSARGVLSGIVVSAMADFDFTDGNRGMARSVRGAKKYVNSRLRHHENAATRRLAGEPAEDGENCGADQSRRAEDTSRPMPSSSAS